MSTLVLPEFESIQDTLIALTLGVDADELHGSLCGLISAGGACGPTTWPEQLALDPVSPAKLSADQPLGQLRAVSIAQLDDAELSFQLLLPEDAPLAARVAALVGWCRGFLGGFGLARGKPASSDAIEALADLARIAGTELSLDDPEQDAESLEELIEFVRVAVLLLASERDPNAAAQSATLH